jgi:hypothetical protein
MGLSRRKFTKEFKLAGRRRHRKIQGGAGVLQEAAQHFEPPTGGGKCGILRASPPDRRPDGLCGRPGAASENAQRVGTAPGGERGQAQAPLCPMGRPELRTQDPSTSKEPAGPIPMGSR